MWGLGETGSDLTVHDPRLEAIASGAVCLLLAKGTAYDKRPATQGFGFGRG